MLDGANQKSWYPHSRQLEILVWYLQLAADKASVILNVEAVLLGIFRFSTATLIVVAPRVRHPVLLYVGVQDVAGRAQAEHLPMHIQA